jgi:hypothetical protein
MTHAATTTRLRAPAILRGRRLAKTLLAVIVSLNAAAMCVWAQESKPKATAQPAGQDPAHPSGRIQYVGPDTYILLDSQGRPQPVPGMTYEDFLAAWKKLNQPPASENQPRFTIENIKLDGQTHGQRAELKLEATIHLLAGGRVDVPLGLVGAILQREAQIGPAAAEKLQAKNQPPPKSRSQTEYLDFDPQHGGFVARLSGNVGDRKSLVLSLIVPLTRDGAETTLPLNFPRCVSSSLTLRVDSAITEARANNGAVTTKNPTSTGGSQVEVAGPTGQFRLTWQPVNSDAAVVATTLNAVGALHISLDGRGVRSDARLTVRSYGGTFDQFRVRLPKGAKLAPDRSTTSQDAKYHISEEPSAGGTAKTPDDSGTVVRVELKEKQQGPVVVDLSTEQPGRQAGESFDLTGFEVIGAVRQYGDIALNVGNDWQARWTVGRNVRQVDPTDLDSSLQRNDLTAAFQYDGQPWSLGVRVSTRQLRTHVTPQYVLELLPEEARLNVRLAYQVFGSRAFEFKIETRGWEMAGDPVESGGLVDQDRIQPAQKGILTLPLNQAVTRKADISFTMRQPLSRETSKLSIPLPTPSADSVGAGDLTVRFPPEVELVPDVMSSTGLVAAPARESSASVPPGGNAELHFRLLAPNAVFAANKSNRSREVSAQASTQIDVDREVLRVDEHINYLVRYEPLKELIFETNSDLPFEKDGFEIALLATAQADHQVAGERNTLRAELIEDQADQIDVKLASQRFRVVLPQPQIGKFTVEARYQIPRVRGSAAERSIEVPLLAPANGEAVPHRAVVTAGPPVAVALDSKSEGSSWKMKDVPANDNSPGQASEFFSDRSVVSLPLNLTTSELIRPSAAIVDRVWLQSWFSNEIEQDRVAFQLRTSNLQSTVELPPDVLAGEIEALVDGRPAELLSREAGRLVVRLGKKGNEAGGGSQQPATHTLELRFRRAVEQFPVTRHLLTPPRIDGTTQLSQLYWQIVLPADQHMIQSPADLIPASRWQWLGSFWGLGPVLSQAELEKWCSASPQIAPAASENQYLFNGLLPISSITIVTAPRWLIVLVASSVTLALLAGLFYLPASLRRWALVVLIFVLAAGAIAYPTAAVLVAQASAIGIVLAPLPALLSRLMSPRGVRVIGPLLAASSQRTLAPRTDSIVMPPAIAAASTAPTATLHASDSER